jgi:hypothetical protein
MKLIQYLPRYQHDDLSDHPRATSLDEGTLPLMQATTQLINSDDVSSSLSIHHAINEHVGGVDDERDGNNSSCSCSSMKDDSYLGEQLPSTVDPSSSSSSIASKVLTIELKQEDSDDNEADDDDLKVPAIDPISALRYALNNELSRSNAMSIKLDLLLLQISDHRDKIKEVLSAIPKLL